MQLIDGWRKEIWRLWSIRVGLVWGAVETFVFVAALISDELKAAIGWKTFAAVLALASISLIGARLLKQPGTDELP